jgi:hypothetical protein
MFNTDELELITKWISFNKYKNDEMKMFLCWEEDEEVEEIDQVISNINNKISQNNLEFNKRELSEIKIGLMWLYSNDINNINIWSLITEINDVLSNDVLSDDV